MTGAQCQVVATRGDPSSGWLGWDLAYAHRRAGRPRLPLVQARAFVSRKGSALPLHGPSMAPAWRV